jgi:hypothetical protein
VYSKNRGEDMGFSRLDTKEDVENFITAVKSILTSSSFCIDTDLDILPKKKSEDALDPYTTANTLAALDFDRYDIRRVLLVLTVADYAETILDNLDPSFPPFFVFYQTIQKKDVYIKIKIRDRIHGKIFCVSFHFARYPFRRPLPYES